MCGGKHTDRHLLNACIMPKPCPARSRPCVFWTIVLLVACQGQNISGIGLNATEFISDVSIDPAMHRKVKTATWKVFWTRMRNGDDILLTGVRSTSARGMPSPCVDSVLLVECDCISDPHVCDAHDCELAQKVFPGCFASLSIEDRTRKVMVVPCPTLECQTWGQGPAEALQTMTFLTCVVLHGSVIEE